MRNHLLASGAGLLCLALVMIESRAAAPPPPPPAKAAKLDDVTTVARLIDRHIAVGYKSAKAEPAPVANDAAFARRVYLDLAGRIPRVSEVRAFLDSKRADKRAELVEKLLGTSNYVNHFTNVWRSLLLPNNNNQQVQFLANQMDGWIKPRIRKNTPYDQMVRSLLTASITNNFRRPNANNTYDQGAAAFYQANEMKPDNISAAVSRLFLGVKIECAQCHDHPFADWKRKQFWEFTAFFAGIKPQNANGGVFTPATDDEKVHRIEMPGSTKKIQAKFLDGTTPTWGEDDKARDVLAKWLTSKKNPYFAKAIANRLWEHFFGIGLVDPVDDARPDNAPSHPKLLDDLATVLVKNDFDLKFLIKAITASKTYQLSSQLTHKSQEPPRLFARASLRGLTPEQIFDSISTAVGYREAPGFRQGFVGFGFTTPRAEFLNRFANPVDRKTETSTSILQALALMNGQFVADATSLDKSEVLLAVIDSPFMTTQQKLDTLFLSALSRKMRSSEAGKLIPYVNNGGPSRNTKKAMADVFWVLLNSSEFILNH